MIGRLLHSRKFYALVAAAVSIYAAFAMGDISHAQAVDLLVKALMTYIGAVAFEDAFKINRGVD